MKNIIFVPGLTSPFHESHKAAYAPLNEEGMNRGYSSRVVCLPGQTNQTGNIEGVLCLQSSVSKLTEIVEELEETGEKYRLVGFSYGCSVVLSTLSKLPLLTGVENVVLWGVVPLWLSWQVFILGEGRNSMGKGTSVIQPEDDFFKQLKPIEYLLPLVNYPIKVAIGADDSYISASYVDYLRSITARCDKKNYSFSVVEGCNHTVRESECKNWQGYLSTIF